MYEKFGQFIDGKWQQSEKKETYEVINPATEEVLGHASKATPVDVDKALKSAEKGLEVWKKTSPWKRSSIIRNIADLIRKKQDVLAKWMTLEVGKPLAEGKGEAGGSADIFEWNSEETKRIYGQTVESRFEDTRVHVYYQPVGVVAALVPWNFSIMAITGPTCLIISTFIVRYYLSDKFDTNSAGSWEAMWRISAIYLLFLISTFKFYLIPTFSKLNNENLKKEVFKIWKVVIPIIIVITAGVYLLRDLIITILLSNEFFLINEIIFFHLLGDIIKINCWVLGNILISKADTKAFVFFQIEWSVIFVILSYFLINAYGFWGVSLAYFITYIIHFTLLNIHLRKLLWVK